MNNKILKGFLVVRYKIRRDFIEQAMDVNPQISYIDLLYGQYFSQLIRTQGSPTYVEKRILGEYAYVLRDYLLQFVDELKKKVDDYKTQSDTSYIVWDRKFYQEQVDRYNKEIDAFKKKLDCTKLEDFLSKDFSSVSKDLEITYPNHLPKSLVREDLAKRWETIRAKHD